MPELYRPANPDPAKNPARFERRRFVLASGKHYAKDGEGNEILYHPGDPVPLTRAEYEAFKDKFVTPQQYELDMDRRRAAEELERRASSTGGRAYGTGWDKATPSDPRRFNVENDAPVPVPDPTRGEARGSKEQQEIREVDRAPAPGDPGYVKTAGDGTVDAAREEPKVVESTDKPTAKTTGTATQTAPSPTPSPTPATPTPTQTGTSTSGASSASESTAGKAAAGEKASPAQVSSQNVEAAQHGTSGKK
jgi:hypothetical protein